jgi:hypothetical protein
MHTTAHVFITASFELVLKGNNGTLGVPTILVLLASPLDPMNLGCSRSTSLTCSSFGLTISSATPTWKETYSGLGECCPFAQTLQ